MGALAPSEWIRKTDVNGRVDWSGLHPADGYRFGLRSTIGFARLDPPYERERPPLGLSGRFAIEAGVDTVLVAALFDAASVRGTLVAANGETVAGAEVRLVHVSPLERSDDGSAASGERGEIEFARVEPGRNELTAFYEWPRGQFHCLAFGFDVAPGQRLDLGAVGTAAGYSVEGVIRYEGEANEPIAVADLFESSTAPLLQAIEFAGPEDSESPCALRGAIRIEVEVERPFFIHGLGEGRLESGCPYAVGSWPAARSRVRFSAGSERSITVPDSATFDVVIAVEAFGIATFVFETPPRAPLQRVEAYFLPTGRGRRFEVDWTTRQEGSATTHRFAVTPGRYRLLVHSEPLADSKSTESYFIEDEIDIVDGGETRIAMKPAASVTCVVGDMAPVREAASCVALGFAPWIGGANARWPYRAAVEQNGRFTVRGLPPHRRIAIRDATDMIETGAPGEERELTIWIR
jgi:hypothetical protein